MRTRDAAAETGIEPIVALASTEVAPGALGKAAGPKTALTVDLGWRLVLFAAGLAALFFVFRHVDWPSTRGYLLQLGVRAPLVLVPGFFVLASDTIAWRATFEQPSGIPLMALFRVRVATEAVAGSLPAGFAAGESLRTLLVNRRFRRPMTEAASNVVVSKLLMGLAQGVFLVGALAASGVMGRRSIHATGTHAVGGPAFAAALAFSCVIGGALVLLSRGRILTRALGRMRTVRERWHAAFARLDEPLAGLDHGFAVLTRLPFEQVAFALAMFLVAWLCLGTESWLVLRLLGAPVPFATAVSIEATVSIVRIGFFFLPGGLGVQEASYYGLLRAYGVPNAEAVAAAFVIAKRLKEVFFVALGYLILLRWPAQNREAHGQEHIPS